MTPRKYVPFLLGALLLAALLLIPFSKDANPASIGKPDGKSNLQTVPGELIVDQLTNIHVNVSLTYIQFQQLQELNRNFMMKYPHIQVKLVNEPSKRDAYTQWSLQSQRGEAADIMLLDNGWVRPFAVKGFLKPADSIMTGDTLTDQMAGLLEPLKWNGYLWGVPKDLNPYFVVWSSALLEEVGLKEPPLDWLGYQAAALKMIELHPEASIVNWGAGDLYQQLVWLSAFRNNLSDGLQVLPVSENQMMQLGWFQERRANISRIDGDETAALTKAFETNKLLAAILTWNDYEKLPESVRGKLNVNREQIHYPWLNGRSYVLSSSSRMEDEAMLWIQEMSDINNQQLVYDRSGQLPARASLYAFNSSLLREQAHIPPEWWTKVLNAKKADQQLPIPDPHWPEKWQQREQIWRTYSETTLEISAYLDALNELDQ
ncbi:extracellular solute-binding protein [Paenibacillus sinopodophylli]|uniref:ABC transporter substrate-binding protein n=1 Tax=Paenibacillus sinopodophylli TaxID=1837342 RepID=UPI00110D16EA|nr:extracellular solute-binding protein [Paenibacillus sinopodophylli]